MAYSEITVGIGGKAGDGIGRSGDSLAQVCARHGVHLFAYNSYQSLIRGGHVWLRIRMSPEKVRNQGEHLNILVALNRETYDRHIDELEPDGIVLYNEETVTLPEDRRSDVHYFGVPVRGICKDVGGWRPVMQNTVLLGALVFLLNFEFSELEAVVAGTFRHKGEEVAAANVSLARCGFDHARRHQRPLDVHFPQGEKRYAVTTGNEMFALGAAAAGCKFYSAYPMTPATAILHWFSKHGPEIGVVVKQCEDELAVINMAIGAGFAGVRAMCATSGGGFSLMTEALGQAGMTETPVVVINCQRGGPSTGLPTKTEQGDFWQLFGASQGDYPKMILAPTDVLDCYYTMAEAFNWAERYQLPVLVASDLYLSEHRETVDPEEIRLDVPIDRGNVLRRWESEEPYLRYRITENGVSPRVLPGTPGVAYTAGTDEHDESGVLISDVYTDPVKRRRMMDKRMRKMKGILEEIPPVRVTGPAGAELTLVGWGSTRGVLEEAAERLTRSGTPTNVITLKYLWPFPTESMRRVLESSRRVIVVEQNYGAQMLRHIRAETGFTRMEFIGKYDGEPMDPRFVIDAVQEVGR